MKSETATNDLGDGSGELARPDQPQGTRSGRKSQKAEQLRSEALRAFAAQVLDFEELRGHLEERALTRLGQRAMRELAPIPPERCRQRFQRLLELRELEQVGELPGLGGLSDPKPYLDRIEEGHKLSGKQLAELATIFSTSEGLGQILRSHAGTSPALGALVDEMPSLGKLGERIREALDERGNLRDEASPRLEQLRKSIRKLEREIDKLLKVCAGRARNVLSDPSPQRRAGRGVLAVRAASSGHVRGIVHDRSQSGETVFVEPREVIEPQNRVVGLRADERAEIDRILLEWTREILGRKPEIEDVAQRMSELEIGLICVGLCREWGARVPEIGRLEGDSSKEGEPGLQLLAARHPLLILQEKSGQIDSAVPLDIRLGEDFDLLLITGPNTGGKTLSLKTTGLFILMVRMGLPIPCADQSRVPFFDGILADIGDEQELRQNLSTFASHLVRIREGMQRCSPRTLFLLDELGGGTDPDEGAALGDALLEWLLKRRVPTMATTHLGKLKEFAYRNARAENASVEFDSKSLSPLYRLLIGTPGESSACAIARRLGLDAKLVDEAEKRRLRREDEVTKLMAEMLGTREEMERARTRLDARMGKVEKQKQELDNERAELERRSEALEAESQRDLESRVREARDALEQVSSVVAQYPGKAQEAMRTRLSKVDDILSGAAWSKRRGAFLDSLTKGQFVYLPRLKRRAVITRIDRANERITVKMGKMPVQVGFDELTAYENL